MTIRSLKPKINIRDAIDTIVFCFWATLKVLIHIWGAFVSPLRPATLQEQTIALWPPTIPLNAWLQRVCFAPWQRWDTLYYIWITTQGYALDNGTAQFHPLYPWFAKPLTWLGFSPLGALWLISTLASLGFVHSFYHLGRLWLSPRRAQLSTLLMLSSPLAFALFLPYPEALFLLWATLSLYWAQKSAWLRASVAGALAVLTRQQGVFLCLPLAWEFWEACDRDWRTLRQKWPRSLSIGLIPLGYVSWLLFRAISLNDLHVDFDNLHTLTYSLLISPSAAQVVPVQTFMWPWRALGLALKKLWQDPDIDIVTNLVGGGYFLYLLMRSWKNLRISYKIYVGVIVWISFSYHTGLVHPYMGLLRHLLLAFPVFIGLGTWAQPKRRHRQLIVLGLLGMFFLLMLYILRVWVP